MIYFITLAVIAAVSRFVYLVYVEKRNDWWDDLG